MPRVRLRVWQNGPALQYTDPQQPGNPQHFPSLRLTTRVLLGPDPQPPHPDNRREANAVVDTGAPFSMIISGTWEAYETAGLVERIPLPPNPPPLDVVGRRFTYELGRMWVSALDLTRGLPGGRRVLPAAPVVFMLLREPAKKLDFPIVLGLHRGLLDGRWLLREAIPPRPTSPEDRYDSGPQFGQEWWLQDEPPLRGRQS